MKKIILMFAAVILLSLMVACEGTSVPDTSTDTLLSVEINPAFELIIGEDGKVKSYKLKNEDAEIIGAGLDLVGLNYEDALKAMLNQAIDTGYIDVDRADQAVALMAANGSAEEENQFRETVQTKLQTFFQENAIGAVLLNHASLDQEVIDFAEEHDISVGIAKLVLSYLEENPEVTALDALELTPKEITDALLAKHASFMNTFQNQREDDALEVQNELKTMAQERVQAHKDAVIAGTKTQPDMTGVEASYMNNYQGMKDTYVARNAERKNQAKAKLSLNVPRLLSVDINPAVEMTIDVNGFVYSVMYKNEDAEIVGAGLDLVGKTYQEALQLYMNASVDTGYIDVTRNDNAVALMAGSLDDELDETFRIQVQTMLQNYFQQNALGAVVLNKAEVNPEVEALVETYDVSYGFAKLVLSYLEAHPEATVDTVILMTPDELIESIGAFQIAQFAQYRSEKEPEMLMIKNEMKSAIQNTVQAHKDAVTAGTKTQPDLSGVVEAYLLNYQSKIQEFVQANEARKAAAKDKVQQGQGLVLSLDINPKIELIIDPEGFVISVMFKNEDAEIVGAGLTLIGLNYEEALHLYLNAAIQTGYIDTERNDNALMLQTSHMNLSEETAFQNEVQTKLQTYFQENAIGAVMLNHGEIDEEVQALVDTYDLSVGKAKLILSYMELNPEVTIDDALLIPIQQLVLHLIDAHQAFMNAYKSEREVGAQAIKNEMVDALRSQVQAHEQAVLNGTKVAPDTTGVRESYLADYDAMHSSYVLRNQERREAAKSRVNQGNPL